MGFPCEIDVYRQHIVFIKKWHFSQEDQEKEINKSSCHSTASIFHFHPSSCCIRVREKIIDKYFRLQQFLPFNSNTKLPEIQRLCPFSYFFIQSRKKSVRNIKYVQPNNIFMLCRLLKLSKRQILAIKFRE